MPAFGIAMIEKGLALVDAFDRSTIASAKAKSDIRNRICIYNSEMQFLVQKESRLLSEFMQALKNREITFYLQPQCRISSKKVVGVEALARWIKPDGTIIPPGDFIPVIEKYGFIPDLDQYIWERVCESLSAWMKAGHKCVPASINVSRADLFSIDITKKLSDLAEKYEIPTNMIKVEITESSYVEASDLVDNLVSKLREKGFSVLMDDFGSGYSSLNMLSTIKLDAIKLDARFLKIDDDTDSKALHILESVVNMAKTIGLPISVEGVETKFQCDFLENLGCRYIQGYYFYRPMPVEEFERLILNEDMIDDRGFVAKLNEQVRIREFLDKNIKIAKSWAVTDCVTSYLKKYDFDLYYQFFIKNYDSKYTYKRRMAYVLGLKLRSDKNILKTLPLIRLNEEYMVMMAEAWLLSVVAIDFEDGIFDYLSSISDIKLKRKTISKICDSFRYSDSSKNRFKGLRN